MKTRDENAFITYYLPTRTHWLYTFAAAALQGFISASPTESPERHAKLAVRRASALFARLEKEGYK